jgi:hypothetical protein
MRAGEIDVAFPNDGATFAAASGAKVTSWLNNQIGLFQNNAFLATSSKFTLPALGMDSFELAWALNVKPA